MRVSAFYEINPWKAGASTRSHDPPSFHGPRASVSPLLPIPVEVLKNWSTSSGVGSINPTCSGGLATMLRSRDDDAAVELLDVAYWMKGCSSLGLLRYCALLGGGGKALADMEMCLMDVKEAAKAAAPRYAGVAMFSDDARRVVEGARYLSPFLGERMRADHLLDRPVFVRELLPQDLKIEISAMSHGEAMKAARFLVVVVGAAHARQMDEETRSDWRRELGKNRSKTLDAPSWLWSSAVDLLVSHERGYLEHCRNYALAIGVDSTPQSQSRS